MTDTLSALPYPQGVYAVIVSNSQSPSPLPRPPRGSSHSAAGSSRAAVPRPVVPAVAARAAAWRAGRYTDTPGTAERITGAHSGSQDDPGKRGISPGKPRKRAESGTAAG